MIETLWLLRGIEGLVLIIGSLIAVSSLRAYRRTGATPLALLGAGFVLVTVAAALAGVLFELVTHDLLTAWTVSTGFDAVGFGLILYSILRPRAEDVDAGGHGPPSTSSTPGDLAR
ncbi:MAG TPA: hypothetical protein VIZ68_05280 [Thermoplasmata archaeon]